MSPSNDGLWLFRTPWLPDHHVCFTPETGHGRRLSVTSGNDPKRTLRTLPAHVRGKVDLDIPIAKRGI